MNAHALAASTTRQPDHYPTTEEWIVHTAAVTLAWPLSTPLCGRRSADELRALLGVWSGLWIRPDADRPAV